MKAFVPSFPPATPNQGGGADGNLKSTGSPWPAESRTGFSSVTLAGAPSAVAFPRKGHRLR